MPLNSSAPTSGVLPLRASPSTSTLTPATAAAAALVLALVLAVLRAAVALAVAVVAALRAVAVGVAEVVVLEVVAALERLRGGGLLGRLALGHGVLRLGHGGFARFAHGHRRGVERGAEPRRGSRWTRRR